MGLICNPITDGIAVKIGHLCSGTFLIAASPWWAEPFFVSLSAHFPKEGSKVQLATVLRRRGTEGGQTDGLGKEDVTIWDSTTIHLLDNVPGSEIH